RSDRSSHCSMSTPPSSLSTRARSQSRTIRPSRRRGRPRRAEEAPDPDGGSSSSPTIQETVMAKAKLDIKTEATRPFFATVGATDLTLEVAVQAATDLQGRVKAFAPTKYAPKSFDLKSLDLKAIDVKTLNKLAQSYAKGAAKDAKDAQVKFESRVKGIRFDVTDARGQMKEAQTKLEARINGFQADVMSLPAKAQRVFTEAVSDAGDAYTELAERGEK